MPGSFAAFPISTIFIINITDKIMFNLNQGEATMSNLNLSRKIYFLPFKNLIWK